MDWSNLHHLCYLIIFLVITPLHTLANQPACKNKCGSLSIQYPLGTGTGCGSPRFQPSISCSASGQLLLSTHSGSYPITSVDYAASTFTLSPPLMSTCSAMHPSPNFGLDWATPFQPGPSRFLLLACSSPASSLTYQGRTPLCDANYAYLCAALYTCPSVSSLGLPLFSPATSCCVYSPANLGPHGDLDVQGLGCDGWSSVISLGDVPTDPTRWQYGVVLKFIQGGLDGSTFAASCEACQKSDGVCGYAPPKNYFICVCKNGVNTSTDCNGQSDSWSGVAGPKSLFSSSGRMWLISWLLAMGLLLVM